MKKLFLILIIGILAPIVYGQTKTEMKVADLQKSITDYIAKNVKTFTIDKAFKVDSKGVITYDVLLKDKDGGNKMLFIFDKDGKFIKRAERGSRGGTQPVQGTKPQPTDQTPPQPKK